MRGPTIQLHTVRGTLGALTALKRNHTPIPAILDRFQWADFGNITKVAQMQNLYSLRHGGRLFGSYRLEDGEKVWLYTDEDRQVATLTTPAEFIK